MCFKDWTQLNQGPLLSDVVERISLPGQRENISPHFSEESGYQPSQSWETVHLLPQFLFGFMGWRRLFWKLEMNAEFWALPGTALLRSDQTSLRLRVCVLPWEQEQRTRRLGTCSGRFSSTLVCLEPVSEESNAYPHSRPGPCEPVTCRAATGVTW